MSTAAQTANQTVTNAGLMVTALTRHRDRDAFVQGERRITYEEAGRTVSQFQQVLAEHGVGHGTGVATLSPNAPEVWFVQAATYLLGGHWTGLHSLGSVDDHCHICADGEIQVLVAHPDVADTAAAIVERSPAVQQVLTIGPSELGADLLDLAAARQPGPLTAGPAGNDDVAWLQFTGGTTGVPKGVEMSQKSTASQALTFLAALGLPDRPRYLASSPITHAALLPILPTLLRGGTVVLQKGFDPEAWLDAVAREQINLAVTVPTMVGAILDAMRSGDDLSSMQTLFYAAAPMSPARISEAWERIGPVLRQVYGSTEGGGCITTLAPDEHDPTHHPERLSSCGQPVIGVRVGLLDEDGEHVTPGEAGEICVRSPLTMTGYWRQPRLTAEALAGGWVHTGDMGRFDDEGYLYIVDRKKDMVISGGFNIYPREIEDVLASHPACSAAAVIGVPDDKWGEAVRAFVTLRADSTVDADELAALVRERKGAHYTPKVIEIVPTLPTTPVGKVDKKALRAPFWSGLTRQVN